MADWTYYDDEELVSPSFDRKTSTGALYALSSDSWTASFVGLVDETGTLVTITAPTITLSDSSPSVTVAFAADSLAGLSGEYKMLIKLTDSSSQDDYIRVGAARRLPTIYVSDVPT